MKFFIQQIFTDYLTDYLTDASDKRNLITAKAMGLISSLFNGASC